jgi:hypothetical protein
MKIYPHEENVKGRLTRFGLLVTAVIISIQMSSALSSEPVEKMCDPEFEFVSGPWPEGKRRVICEKDGPENWPYEFPSAGVECVPAEHSNCPVVHVGGAVYSLTGRALACGAMNGWDWQKLDVESSAGIWRFETVRNDKGEVVRLPHGATMTEYFSEAPVRAVAEELGCASVEIW